MWKHTRIFAFAIAALYAAAFPIPIHAQWTCSSPPCTSGNIWYSNGYVGIGTATSPFGPLQIHVGANENFLVDGPVGVPGAVSISTANDPFTANTPMEIRGNPVAFLIGNVGIGTVGPAAPLEVSGGDSGYRGGIQLDDRGDGCCSQFRMTSGKTIWDLYSASSGLFYIYGVTTHTGSSGAGAIFNITDSGYVGIGTTDPCTNSQAPSNCKLSVAGAIQAYDVTVNNSWSDYVFDPDYRLAPLSEVAGYIRDHHHLPNIPSADEVQEKGLSVGDMQAKLLAKIEELTLHMIEAEKENRELRERITRLEARDSR